MLGFALLFCLFFCYIKNTNFLFFFFQLTEYRRALQGLHNSPPPGFAYRLLFTECCDVDPKSVGRSIMDRQFEGTVAPWDIDRVGTQFALFCHIENLPNINNVVHLVIMTIFPKGRTRKAPTTTTKSVSKKKNDTSAKDIDLELNPPYETKEDSETSSSEGSSQEEEDADEYD